MIDFVKIPCPRIAQGIIGWSTEVQLGIELFLEIRNFGLRFTSLVRTTYQILSATSCHLDDALRHERCRNAGMSNSLDISEMASLRMTRYDTRSSLFRHCPWPVALCTIYLRIISGTCGYRPVHYKLNSKSAERMKGNPLLQKTVVRKITDK